MDRRSRTSVAELAPPAAPPERKLGDRVRRLRNARGLTQSELAEARVSKEYISQIETGKTRPTRQTLEWLAERLGVDFHYLEGGVSEREYRQVDAVVTQAEEAIGEKRYRDAVDLVGSVPRTPDAPDLHLRALFAESWGRMYLGDVRAALDVLERARGVAESEVFDDVHRSEVQYRLGCCRYKLSAVEQALRHFSHALDLAEGSQSSCDVLRANILQWRSRSHSERAKELYEAVDDPVNVGKLLNNLGILSFQLGDAEQAVEQLKNAFRIALEVGDEAVGAQ